MGQQQSSDGIHPRQRRRRLIRRRQKQQRSSSEDGFEVIGDEDDTLEEKIQQCRNELKVLIDNGVAQDQNRQSELNQMDLELYEKKLELHHIGERAKVFFSFWDYVKIVQSIAYRNRKKKKKKKATASLTVSSTGMTCASSNSSMMAFTIFGFFEAYLLRRLHLALLLQNQCLMQKHGWNDIIVYLYDKIPETRRDAKKANVLLAYVKEQEPHYQEDMQDTIEQLLFLQEKLMFRLRHGEQSLSGFEYAGGYPVIQKSMISNKKAAALEAEETKTAVMDDDGHIRSSGIIDTAYASCQEDQIVGEMDGDATSDSDLDSDDNESKLSNDRHRTIQTTNSPPSKLEQ